ncbi:MAG TPA: ParB/RepB/Spo0J family partition protein [bacterium]|nr:ParB/RepB/Spo0J family partition protein [bacterium]
MHRKALGKGLEALIRDTGEGTRGEQGDILSLDIERIRFNPQQPRHSLSEKALDELRRSILEKGIIQPIVVRPIEGDEKDYQLVVGERRLRAARLAGLKNIPCVITDIETDEELLELALIENIQREDLNPIDQANAFKALLEKFGMTQEEISIRIGKDRSTIANLMRLLGLPPRIREMVIEGSLSAGSARALLSLEDSNLQTKLAERIVRDGLSVRKVEQLTKKYKSEEHEPPIPQKINPIIESLCENLRRYLGTSVSIQQGKKKGRIEIAFYSDDDLERIIHLIRGLKPEEILDSEAL